MTWLFDGTVTDQNKIPVSGAKAYIYGEDGELAELFDELGQSIEQPLISGDDGYWSAYTPQEGFYTARYFWGGRERLVEANLALGRSPLERVQSYAASAEAAGGPTYPDTATGLAATVDGEGFAVDNGDGTVTVYLNVSGVAVAQRTLATAAYLASVEGASRIGMADGATTQQAIRIASTRAALLASSVVPLVGSRVRIADGHEYEVVTTGQHLTTAGGVKLKALPDSEGRYSLDAFTGDGLASTILPLLGDNTAFRGRNVVGGSNIVFRSAGESVVPKGISLKGDRARNTTNNGIEFGARAPTPEALVQQQARTGYTIRDFDFENIGAVTGSVYGIAVVAERADIGPGRAGGLANTSANEGEVGYFKLKDSRVHDVHFFDGGYEACVSIKGAEPGNTGGPAGHSNFFENLLITCSTTFAAARGGSPKDGLKIGTGGQKSLDNIRLDGWTGTSWRTDPGDAASWTLPGGYDINCTRGGEIRSQNGTYKIEGRRFENISGVAMTISGQTGPTAVRFVGDTFDNIGGHAFYFAPATPGKLSVRIIGSAFSNLGGLFAALAGANLSTLIVRDNEPDKLFTSVPIDFVVFVDDLIEINDVFKFQTNSATPATAWQSPVMDNGAGGMKVEVVGTRGNNSYTQTFEVGHTNNPANPNPTAEVSETTGTAIKTPGAASWLFSCSTTGRMVRLRAQDDGLGPVVWRYKINGRWSK